MRSKERISVKFVSLLIKNYSGGLCLAKMKNKTFFFCRGTKNERNAPLREYFARRPSRRETQIDLREAPDIFTTLWLGTQIK